MRNNNSQLFEYFRMSASSFYEQHNTLKSTLHRLNTGTRSVVEVPTARQKSDPREGTHVQTCILALRQWHGNRPN